MRTILLKQDVDISEVERWLTAFSQSTGEDFASRLQAVLKEVQNGGVLCKHLWNTYGDTMRIFRCWNDCADMNGQKDLWEEMASLKA